LPVRARRDALLARADAALYIAKRQGRDRVAEAGSEAAADEERSEASLGEQG